MPSTTLIILGGFAGAGKTTAAKRLSAAHGLPLLATDEINDALRAGAGMDFATASPLSHDLAWSLAQDHLKNDVSVLMDTNLCGARTWENIDRLKAALPGVTVLPIVLTCSLETHRRRVEHRGATQPEHLNLGGAAFDDVVHKYTFINSLQRDDLIRVDAEGSPDDVLASVVTVLRERAPAVLLRTAAVPAR